MTENTYASSTSFHWLKPPDDSVYHAYPSFRVGTQPACGRGGEVNDWPMMDLPGDNAACCNYCFAILTGFDPRVTRVNAAGIAPPSSTSRE